MKRLATTILHCALIIALAVGIVKTSNAHSLPHDPAELAKIISQHHTQTEDHGHAHDDMVDLIHAFHGHAHEMADHDHNIAFLLPRRGTSFIAHAQTQWVMMQIAMSGRRAFDLDKPPRS